MGLLGRVRAKGVTLIEVLVVSLLVAVVISLGTPALSRIMDSMRLSVGVNSFFSAIVLARSEAASRRGRVVLCKSAAGDLCTKSGGWEQGWIVFHDTNNNAVIDPGEAVLSREQALPSGVRLRGNTPVANYVSYTPDGSTQHTSGAFQSGTFTACLQSYGQIDARTIVIYKSGRPRISEAIVESCPG